MDTKEIRIHVRAEEALKRQISKAAEVTKKTESQFVRDALTEKLARLARKHPEIQAEAV